MYKSIQLELLRLFRRSNVLFLFLFVYLLITPVGRAIDYNSSHLALSAEVFFNIISNSFSIFGLLMIALFMVNSVGNEFNEGSYRRMLAHGHTKQKYYIGKLMLILIIGFMVVIVVVLSYLTLGNWIADIQFSTLLSSIPLLKTINQFVALIYAGLFGFFFILVFRTRTIGLVFFPFWGITELMIYAMEKAGKIKHVSMFLPGLVGWNIFNSHTMNMQIVLVITMYSLVFLSASWCGLSLRE